MDNSRTPFSRRSAQAQQARTRALDVRRMLVAAGLSALAVAGAIAIAALTPGRAQAAALDQFKQFVASTQSAKGAFTQRLVRNENGNAKVVNTSSGSFVFSRPGKFIWTYQKPYEQVIQADGEKLFIYDKDLNQVTTKKLGNALGSSPAAILFGSNDLEKNFNLKEAGAKDGLEWLEAVPKSKDTTFDSIGIGLKNGTPVAMELHDSFGQVSVLSFDSFEKNPPLKVNSFSFTIPKGADVFSN
ncbi:outer membrane lipoprotein chaperone LolA [Herbaspirillum sp. WKF16]|uniref:outer membrane lipoprotein chaperone LolA n=1 Tax=Herbaspirillum sp. WKF16 TaxID=3028312 RepID=UPI0023A993BC|nr:outer membrane lipoprotein chaperone LolA [Herbaspirillum sp. WKF16]WDZ97837.1 outer membrane lipoprotein chaperone LolA [Herbaspirillum sp. WKF16]